MSLKLTCVSGLLALLLAACSASAPATPTASVPVVTAVTTATMPAPLLSPTSLPTAFASPSSPALPSQTVPAFTPSPGSSPTLPPSRTPFPSHAAAEAIPDPAAYRWELVLSDLNSPVGLANAADGSDRLFVLEQAGQVRIVQHGQLAPEPFLDLSAQVSCCGERGLLGIAFHPRYAENGYFYVNYTDLNGDTVIARFRVSADPNRADPASQQQLIFVDQPYGNHNGGGLAFGPDGYLYLGLGDGGNAGDPQGNGQSLDTLLGKLLRIDVDAGSPYAIPPDNPYARDGGLPEIWAYGLRNPWRFSFDRQNGDLYIGDVGQGEWEEVDFLPAGSAGGTNFGWNYREGAHPFQGTPPTGLALADPVAEYPHNPDYSITGGYVYRGASLPAWQGVYVYGDYASGRVWGLLRGPDGKWQNRLLFETRTNITSFGEDEAGELYLVDHKGHVYRLSKP